jgi:hypothetical protein
MAHWFTNLYTYPFGKVCSDRLLFDDKPIFLSLHSRPMDNKLENWDWV